MTDEEPRNPDRSFVVQPDWRYSVALICPGRGCGKKIGYVRLGPRGWEERRDDIATHRHPVQWPAEHLVQVQIAKAKAKAYDQKKPQGGRTGRVVAAPA